MRLPHLIRDHVAINVHGGADEDAGVGADCSIGFFKVEPAGRFAYGSAIFPPPQGKLVPLMLFPAL